MTPLVLKIEGNFGRIYENLKVVREVVDNTAQSHERWGQSIRMENFSSDLRSCPSSESIRI